MSRASGSRLSLVALITAVTAAACGQGGGDTSQESTDPLSDQPTADGGSAATEPTNVLLNPTSEEMNETAPDVFQAKFETSKGDFVIEVHREWAPNGADRFYNLVRNGFYDGVHFFRVLDGFVAQFGISGDPQLAAVWRRRPIPDDSVQVSNARGSITYAMAGPNTRTTQVFINYVDNSRLDDMGFAPFGSVVEGMEVVDALYSGYGEGAPSGAGPSQARIQAEGKSYLEGEFPELDSVGRAFVIEDSSDN